MHFDRYKLISLKLKEIDFEKYLCIKVLYVAISI